MKDIEHIYKMLDWRNPLEIQLKGIEFAKEFGDISLLIQPAADISIWENCARAVYEISDDRLQPYLPSLLEWIQDLNWPGALTILERLKVFSGEKLKKPFVKFVVAAIQLKNEEGLKWLDNLSELLDNESLKEKLPSEIRKILQKHYHNCGWWYQE